MPTTCPEDQHVARHGVRTEDHASTRALSLRKPSRPRSRISNTVLLNILKDELFAIESEKLSGTLSQTEYAQIKTGLEAVLKRALNRK